MKIHVKFRGIPTLYKVMNKKREVDLDIPGNTVGDTVNALITKYGAPVKKALFDREDEIDMDLRVVVNDRVFLEYGKRMQTALNEGDSLLFMGGG